MRLFRPQLNRFTLLAPFAAVGAIASVLLLTILAASPSAHAWFHPASDLTHARSAADHDDGCGINTFAHGHANLAPAEFSVAPFADGQTESTFIADAYRSSRQDVRLPPGRGPPNV